MVISDDEEWMATPTPAPAPAPTLAVAHVYVVVATPTESSATSTPVPPPTVPVVDEEMGWTCKYYFKQASETAYYHTLLTHMLDDYFTDLHASINYYCAEYQHPLEATFWKVELVVTAWNDIKHGHAAPLLLELGHFLVEPRPAKHPHDHCREGT